LFKKTWGEAVVGRFSIGAVMFLGILGGIAAIFFASLIGIFALTIAVAVAIFIFWIILFLLTITLNGIYITALYNYATKKKLPKGFSEEFIKSAFIRK